MSPFDSCIAGETFVGLAARDKWNDNYLDKYLGGL